jgi:hypothetical protein
MTIFYESITEIKARVWLIYYVAIPIEMEILPHFDVSSKPQEIEGQTLYCNPQTQELWYE